MISKQYRIVKFVPTEAEREEDRLWIVYANPLKLSSAGFVPIYENKCLETEVFMFIDESPTCIWLMANAEYGKFFWAPVAEDYEVDNINLNGKDIEAYFHKEMFDSVPDDELDEDWPEYMPDKWCLEYRTETLIPYLYDKRNEIWREYQEYILKRYKDNPISIYDFIKNKYHHDYQFAEWLFGNKDLKGLPMKDLCQAYQDEWNLFLYSFDL